MGLLLALNTINLFIGLYMFFITTSILIGHDVIKKESNKARKMGERDYPEITDFDIRLMGGLFAFLTIYFFWNFGNMCWFGNPII
jgi:hypothetical protein